MNQLRRNLAIHRIAMMAVMISLATVATFGTLTGCKTVTDPNTGEVTKVFDGDKAAAVTRTTAHFGAYAWLKGHPNDAVWFKAAIPAIRASAASGPVDAQTFAQMLADIDVDGVDRAELMLGVSVVTELYNALFAEWQTSTNPNSAEIKKVLNAVADGFALATLPMSSSRRGQTAIPK